MWMSTMQIIIWPVLGMRNVRIYMGQCLGPFQISLKKPLEKGRVGTTSGIFKAVQGDSESAFAEKSGFEHTIDRHFRRPPSPKGMGQDDLSCQAKGVKSPYPHIPGK